MGLEFGAVVILNLFQDLLEALKFMLPLLFGLAFVKKGFRFAAHP